MSSRPSLLVVLALGCAHAPAPPAADPATPPVSAAQVTEIRLERLQGGIYASGPAYVFTLRKEGLSTYTGTAQVPMLGDYHVVIPQAAFSALAEKLLANGFFTRRAVYLKGQCADVRGVRVSLTIGGTAEALAPSCPGAEFEHDIAAPIDSVAGRLPWSVSLKL